MPFVGADASGAFEEVEGFAGTEFGEATLAIFEQLLAGGFEACGQLMEKGESRRGEYLLLRRGVNRREKAQA